MPAHIKKRARRLASHNPIFIKQLNKRFLSSFLSNGRNGSLLFGIFLNKSAKDFFTILTKLNHSRKNINILIRLTCRSSSFTLNFHDEKLRMNLHQYAF